VHFLDVGGTGELMLACSNGIRGESLMRIVMLERNTLIRRSMMKIVSVLMRIMNGEFVPPPFPSQLISFIQ
jgi:hypothetical protein